MKTMQQIKIPNHYYSNQYSFYKIVVCYQKKKTKILFWWNVEKNCLCTIVCIQKNVL